MNASRPHRALLAFALTLAVATAPALAQTGLSEWQQRVAPGTTRAPAKDAKPRTPQAGAPKQAVKSQPVAPGTAPAAPLPGTHKRPQAGKPQLGPATQPNESFHTKTGGASDPAYEAYDQGKYLTALALAKTAAEAGEPQAWTLIGRIHAEGLAVGQDYKAAAQAYAKGAELGDLEAAFSLGALHAQGLGVDKDFDKAATYFERAALKGHPLANYNLALLFLRGQGKAENPRRAFAHMMYAAEHGVVTAQYDLGTMLTVGTGTEPNAFEGAKWIGRAARAGHVEAEIEYAVILFKLDGDPANSDDAARLRAAHREALSYLISAASKGNPVGQNRLARCYANGLGTEVNLLEAAKWHFIAKDGGVDDPALEKLIAKLSRSDRQKAQIAADEWRDRSLVQ